MLPMGSFMNALGRSGVRFVTERASPPFPAAMRKGTAQAATTRYFNLLKLTETTRSSGVDLRTNDAFTPEFMFILFAVERASWLSRRRLNRHQTHVDVLAAARLMTVHGKDVVARLQRVLARGVQR